MNNKQKLIAELLELSRKTQYIKPSSPPQRLLWRCWDESTASAIDVLLTSICQLEDRQSLKLEDVKTDNKWEAEWVYNIFHHLVCFWICNVGYKCYLSIVFPNKEIATNACDALRVILHPEYEGCLRLKTKDELDSNKVKELQTELLEVLKDTITVRRNNVSDKEVPAVFIYNTSVEACQRLERILSQGCQKFFPRPEMISGIDNFSDIEKELLQLIFIGVYEAHEVGAMVLLFCRSKSFADDLHKNLIEYLNKYFEESIEDYTKRAEDHEVGAYDKCHQFKTLLYVLNKTKDIPYISDHEANEQKAGVMGCVEEAIREMDEP